MKKIMISAAIFAAIMVSCTTEIETEFSEVENTANTGLFDAEIAKENDAFIFACKSIISVHKDFDYFRELLPLKLLVKIDNGTYSIDEAVRVIFLWWNNERTFDVLIEWPEWDNFYSLLPEKYYEEYPFYW